MSDLLRPGVIYTEHVDLRIGTRLASLWSYESGGRTSSRATVLRNDDGNPQYELEYADPLLNTILPGTAVSLVLNLDAPWTVGRSLANVSVVPSTCVIGPVTEKRILRLGPRVRAIGAVIPSTLTAQTLGVPALELVDRIVPLENLWGRDAVARLMDAIGGASLRRQLMTLRDAVGARIELTCRQTIEDSVSGLIDRYQGRVSIDALARRHFVSRQQLARHFSAATGMNPKIYARVTRFQALVSALLSTDVSAWASLAPAAGFYDQAHMINEFRVFTGLPPTEFFQPHDDSGSRATLVPRGRPSQWLRRGER